MGLRRPVSDILAGTVKYHRPLSLCWLIITCVLFSQNGAVAAAVFQAWRASGAKPTQPIALPSSDQESDPGRPSGEAADNPLAAVDVPKKAVIAILALSIGGSIASAFIFVVSILYLCQMDQMLISLLVCCWQGLITRRND